MNNNSSSNNNNQIVNELKEFGFSEEKIKLALNLSQDKNEIINIIIRMEEEPDFYNNIQQNTQNNILSNPFENSQMSLVPADQYKMVIVVREDLNMGRGKIAAQVAHAVLGAYKQSLVNNTLIVNAWEKFSGQAKIVLGCKDINELNELKNQADNLRLITCQICDAGRTEVEPGTVTCMAIGPNVCSEIDKVTGKLKLLK